MQDRGYLTVNNGVIPYYNLFTLGDDEWHVSAYTNDVLKVIIFDDNLHVHIIIFAELQQAEFVEAHIHEQIVPH